MSFFDLIDEVADDIVSFDVPVEIKMFASVNELKEFVKLHGEHRVFALPDAAAELRKLGINARVVARLSEVRMPPAALVALDQSGKLDITIVVEASD